MTETQTERTLYAALTKEIDRLEQELGASKNELANATAALAMRQVEFTDFAKTTNDMGELAGNIADRACGMLPMVDH